MNEKTIAALAEVNRRFYRERASEFSASRERPWPGWSELFEQFEGKLPGRPSVLDVGCGNGRFARFLEGALPAGFDYYGVDESALGLWYARERLAGTENVTLCEHDFIGSEHPLPPTLRERPFDLVVLFGVVHHVPGAETRRTLLQSLSRHVHVGGFLVYTLWRFDRHERFRRKIVPWPDFLEESGLAIDPAELEPGDHILRWGGDGPPYRYCHAMSDEEASSLARSLPLTRAATFDARSEPNTYYILRTTARPEGAGPNGPSF